MRGTRLIRTVLLVVGCACLASCLGPPLTIVPTTLPNAVQGRIYRQNLNTSENRGLQWNITAGSLPPGIELDAQSGLLGGMPTQAGSFDFTVGVTESLPRRMGSRAYTLEVLPILQVLFQPTPARINEAYEYTPLIDGGVPPYTVTVTGLPAGLDADPATGTISGTPLTENSGLRLVIEVVDSGDPQQAGSQHGTLVVHPLAVSITTTTLPDAPVNTDYTGQLKASDGLEPYVWRITAGTLPAGLRANQYSGEISGKPTSHATTETFTASVTDSDTPASTASRELKIVVPVIITATSLPAGHVQQDYEESVGAAAGLPPYTWAISAGNLPDGLKLNASTGAISGQPNASTSGQTFDFTVAVTDSDSPPQSATQDLGIQILP